MKMQRLEFDCAKEFLVLEVIQIFPVIASALIFEMHTHTVVRPSYLTHSLGGRNWPLMCRHNVYVSSTESSFA